MRAHFFVILLSLVTFKLFASENVEVENGYFQSAIDVGFTSIEDVSSVSLGTKSRTSLNIELKVKRNIASKLVMMSETLAYPASSSFLKLNAVADPAKEPSLESIVSQVQFTLKDVAFFAGAPKPRRETRHYILKFPRDEKPGISIDVDYVIEVKGDGEDKETIQYFDNPRINRSLKGFFIYDPRNRVNASVRNKINRIQDGDLDTSKIAVEAVFEVGKNDRSLKRLLQALSGLSLNAVSSNDYLTIVNGELTVASLKNLLDDSEFYELNEVFTDPRIR